MDPNVKYIDVGDKVHVSLLSNGETYGTCVDTTVVEFDRKYLIEFIDGSKEWFTNYAIQHLLTSN